VSGDPKLLRRLAVALIDDGYELVAISDIHAALRKSDTTALLYLTAAMEHLPKLGELGAATVVVLGGGPETQRALRKARPMMTQGRVCLHHLDDADELWSSDGVRTKLGELVEGRAELTHLSDADISARLDAGLERLSENIEELERFQTFTGRSAPKATYGIIAIIAVFFGLEMLWGGAETMPTLVRMGALVRERALGDEWWRMLSCTFLHAGVMHALFNGYVLFAIGVSLEPVLGTPRFCVLYGLSAIGGSIASTVFLGEGVSVGASGAIWGLLAAEAVLAYRPNGLLPAVALPALRKAALINLAINIANSFRPQVDWAAHAGGGVIGGLLLLTGVLTAGLPKLAEMEHPESAEDRQPPWVTPTAVALMAILLACGVYAPWHGQPWRLGSVASPVRVALADSGATVEIPDLIATPESVAREQDNLHLVFGQLLGDPAVAEISLIPVGEVMPAETLEAELNELARALGEQVPEGAGVESPGATKLEGGRGFYDATYRFENGLRYQISAVLMRDHFMKVEVVVWPEFVDGAFLDGASKITRSLELP